MQVKTARRLLYADLGRSEEDSTNVFIFDSRGTVFGFNLDLSQIFLSEQTLLIDPNSSDQLSGFFSFDR